ncbi:conserved oligomeric Golgi complex subunit 1 isoform X1 [Gallus gallus]|uniref:conserved oligomeric Golgi complex subunit 1 isoform X1 n=1 Tax=Gallus gallus TaxID=9031 RepID=UPI001AE185C7|nr:conserved oligomeric Golgi complex subunit 1 isoform X1 [Gallus gallus]XP_015135382.2 conserved oligomeric Golgi complex subunit 1 isoform X1 [Gallus gallus]XP_046785394.1 conserved oligomeric Golgi complex subunit 1 isoform X1 [Gallus gallus]XP_046785395.1 conserved oligomeric Golgi complex subunit 1 isoform X1 [Gallus gallus]
MAAMAARGAEAEALFETHTAAELREAERRLRAGIEQKREELRQMVGERYRDLIEAADTIAEMRLSAERLLGSVRGLQRGGVTRPGPAPPAPPRVQEKLYRAAAQLKLLLDIPERAWSAMEAGRYLPAARLYLLCRHLHGLLQLDAPRARYSPVLARFPILLRQVAAASHFRSTILQESKSLLKSQTVSDQAVAEALCAIMLLEDSSPRQALADFLLARKLAIQQLLNQPHHGAGIKAQVCSLMELLTTTLYQAHALFYMMPEGVPPDPALPCGLLFSTLESTTGQQPAGKGGVLEDEVKLSSWFRYLPESVVEFQPTLRTLAHPISQDYLRDTLQKWIAMCSEDIRAGVSNLLVYVKSLKGLAGIRDAVWELLTSESISQNWDVLCRRLLDKPASFWEDLLRQLFLDRLEILTKEGFESISSSSKQLLILALQELEAKSNTSAFSKHIQFEHNMAQFLWSESSSDLPSDAAWVNVANRSQFAKSGLSMKAQALTPCIQSFCSALDSKLKARLDDLLSYLPAESSPTKELTPPVQPRSSFDRYADTSMVEGLLRDHCIACIHHVLSCVREELQGAQADAPSDTRLHAVLFMARLCQSLSELCPHLKQCILGRSGSVETALKETRSTKKLGKGKVQEVNPVQAKWQEVKAELLQQSLAAYQIWSSAVTKALVQCFTQTLLLDTAGSVLAAATNWDEIEIQEEAESGNSVTSKIRLPMQPSWYVQCLLFNLCQEVNRVGGHTLPKVTLQELLKACMAEVLAAYEKLMDEKQDKKAGTFPMTQNRALQLLYDLRYLNIILTAKSEEAKTSRIKHDSRIEKVTDFLEGHIDPFDLDVFTPHLNSNLNRLVQRTSVLFGLLTGTENQYASRSGALGSQELHNILPLASSQIRFGLLPLSMSSSRKTKSATRNTERVECDADL